MRCAIYCRISEDRAGKKAGVTRQLEDCRALAVARGWTVVEEYIDNDISAFKGDHRPRYQDLLAAMKAGEFDHVVVYTNSRIWRNRIERAQGIELFRNARVGLVPVGGSPLDFTTATGRQVAGLLGEVDTAESDLKSERVARAALERAEKGRPHGGGRPFGYGIEVGKNADGEPVIDTTLIRRDEAEELKVMYLAVLAGIPLASIIRGLHARGVKTARGGEWTSRTVRSVLSRARNAGLREHQGAIIGKATWAPIVDVETFERTKVLLADPDRRTSTGNRASYLLSGIALCGTCEHPLMSGGRKPPSKQNGPVVQRTYRCRQSSHVSRRADWVEDWVIGHLVERLSRPDAADLLKDADRPDFAALHAEGVTLRARMVDLSGMFAEGEITKPQLKEGTEKLTKRLAEIDRAQVHVSRAPALRELVEAPDVGAKFEKMTLDQQRAAVASVMTIRLLPGGAGRRTFDSSKVPIEWKV